MRLAAVALLAACAHAPPPELAARKQQMQTMTTRVNAELFSGEPQVTCWMCHRGQEVPPADAPAAEASRLKLSPADAARPAGEVFRNVKVLGAVPAARFGAMMSAASRELGVQCTHCHVAGDFASDGNKVKSFARRMFATTAEIAAVDYAGRESPVSCWTCHRGRATPQAKP